MKTPSILATLTILVCIATAGLGFVSGVKVKELKADRDNAYSERDEARKNEQAANNALDRMRDEKEEMDARLSQLTLELGTANADLKSQIQRAQNLERQLNDVTRSRNDYERQLSLWDAIGLSIDDAKTLRDDLREAENEIDILREEGAALARRVTVLDNKLKLYELDDYEVKLSPTISGRVTAIDPKYHFVILNVGRDQDLLEQGKLSISRNGELVAKARVTSVRESTAVANILPGWSIENVREGDMVMAAFEAIQN
jgi:flagellar biosynthesis chaperone FliJ